MQKNDEPRTIPEFEHENAIMHDGMVNRRSMIMLICVCVTFIVITAIFVMGYTVRERNMLSLIAQRLPAVAEVSDGVHEQPDP